MTREPAGEAFFVEGTSAARGGTFEFGALFRRQRLDQRFHHRSGATTAFFEQRTQLLPHHLARPFAIAGALHFARLPSDFFRTRFEFVEQGFHLLRGIASERALFFGDAERARDALRATLVAHLGTLCTAFACAPSVLHAGMSLRTARAALAALGMGRRGTENEQHRGQRDRETELHVFEPWSVDGL